MTSRYRTRGAIPCGSARTETISELSAKTGVRPVHPTLDGLSARAANYLARLDIQTVIDFEDWNAWSLSMFNGGGRKTVQEIVDAAARAGVTLAALDHKYPWQRNPARWTR